MTDPSTRPGTFALRRFWPDWAPLVAFSWAVVYALVQLLWVVSGTDVPWSPAATYPPWMLVLLAALALAAAAACVVVIRRAHDGGGRFVSVAMAISIPVFAAGMVSLPAHLVTVASGAGIDSIAALLQVLLSTAGVCLLVPTALAHRRRSRGECPRCGRRHSGDGALRHPAPAPADRRARIAVYLLLLGLAPWAVTKTVWVLGGDLLGVSAEGWRRANEHEPPAVRMLAEFGIDVTVLAAAAAVFLSSALLHMWGQAMPRWVPLLGGRRVPRLLLLLPALLCGVGLSLYGSFLIVYAPLSGWGVLPVPEVAEPFTSVEGVTWMTFFGGLAFGGLGFGLLIGARSYLSRTRPWCDLSDATLHPPSD